ncbi:MAG: hypothetical protein PSX36_06780 [bacterium]|nr:hypothetical protein [bacterium]
MAKKINNKELFETQVLAEFERRKQDFNVQYKKSVKSDLFLKQELKNIDGILFDCSFKRIGSYTTWYGQTFETKDVPSYHEKNLIEIQQYIQTVYLSGHGVGQHNDFGFVLQYKIHSYVYAEAWYRFYKYLQAGKFDSKQPPHTVVAAFCRILDDSKIRPRQGESHEQYCKNICTDFNLVFATRVYKGLGDKVTTKNITMLKELILPQIPQEIAKKVLAYIQAKYMIVG